MPATTRTRAKLPRTAEVPSSSPLVSSLEPEPAPTPTAQSKRKSGADDDDDAPAQVTETVTPKRQKLSVRKSEDSNGRHRRLSIEVQLPSSRKKNRPSESQVADSQDDVGSEDDGPPDPSSVSRQLHEEAIQRLSQELGSSDEADAKPAAGKPTPTPKAKKAKAAAPTPTPAAAKKKGKHVVFGGDEDVDDFVTTAAAEKKEPTDAKDSDADSSDDDAAPEAVSTATAKETLKSAQSAVEAAEKHAASLKKKRQERDNLLKKQAEKRKRDEQKSQAKASKQAEKSEAAEKDKAKTGGRHRTEKTKLPNILPAELLTDSDSESEDDEAAAALRKPVKPTKIRFDAAVQSLGKEGKAPRDQVRGSTLYRVLAKPGDGSLAPRMDKNSRNLKEGLLRRGRVGAAPAKSKGFFKKR